MFFCGLQVTLHDWNADEFDRLINQLRAWAWGTQAPAEADDQQQQQQQQQMKHQKGKQKGLQRPTTTRQAKQRMVAITVPVIYQPPGAQVDSVTFYMWMVPFDIVKAKFAKSGNNQDQSKKKGNSQGGSSSSGKSTADSADDLDKSGALYLLGYSYSPSPVHKHYIWVEGQSNLPTHTLTWANKQWDRTIKKIAYPDGLTHVDEDRVAAALKSFAQAPEADRNYSPAREPFLATIATILAESTRFQCIQQLVKGTWLASRNGRDPSSADSQDTGFTSATQAFQGSSLQVVDVRTSWDKVVKHFLRKGQDVFVGITNEQITEYFRAAAPERPKTPPPKSPTTSRRNSGKGKKRAGVGANGSSEIKALLGSNCTSAACAASAA